MSLDNVRYDAFISYRHCELDSFISENLHKKLESYKMPSSVVKKLGPKKHSIERVFRDEAELPLSGNLSDPITAALDNSDFLIVICTPRLRQSQWCMKEIETFVSTHDRDHVLLVLAEGEPEESFPEILLSEERVVKDSNGNDVTVTVEREPLAADCRADSSRQRLKMLDNVVLKLCAAIFSLNYDDLRQRHRERLMRRRVITASVAFSIVTVFALTCLFFMIRISRQSRIIADKYAGAVAAASSSLLSEGLLKDSVYAARSVLPDDSSSGYNADAYYALSSALAPYEISNCYYPSSDFAVPKDMNGMGMSADLPYVIINCDGYSEVIDTRSSETVLRVESEYAVLDENGVVYIDEDLKAVHTDLAGNDEMILAEDVVDVFHSDDHVTVLFTYNGITAYAGTGKLSDIELGSWWSDDGDSVESVYIGDSGNTVAFALSSIDGIHVGAADVSKGTFRMLTDAGDYEEPVVAADTDNLYLYYEESTMDGEVSANITAFDIGTGMIRAERRLSGDGFYRMLIGDGGLLLVSDRMSYVLDEELDDISVITGYMDSVCEFSYSSGFVLLDRTGRMYTAGIFSTDDKCFELYGHTSGTFLSYAGYDKPSDRLYVSCVSTGRMSIYESRGKSEAVSDIGDGIMVSFPDNMPDTGDLSGIEDISVFSAAASDDGKLIAVSSNDDILYFYDGKSGELQKTLYNSGIALLHTGFVHLNAADVYIVEGRVFDSALNMIGRLPEGEIVAKGADGKSVYLRSRFEEDELYRVQTLSYEDLIGRADELLGGYIPGSDVRSRYSIN